MTQLFSIWDSLLIYWAPDSAMQIIYKQGQEPEEAAEAETMDGGCLLSCSLQLVLRATCPGVAHPEVG